MIDFGDLLARGRGVYPVDLLWRTVERYARDECAVYATAVAFSVLLSLFPLLTVFVAIFGLLTALPGLGPWVARLAADEIPGDNLRRLVESISGVPVAANGVAGFVALATLIWAASGMFGRLRRALNRAFGMASPPVFVRARALDLAGVGVLFLLGLLSIGLAAALGALRGAVGRFAVVWPAILIWTTVEGLIPYATLVAATLLLYLLLPSRALRARELWPAALVAGAGLYVTSVGFGYYVANFAQFQQVYGALAGAVALLAFLNLDATILLFAAGLAAEAARDRRGATT